MTEHLENIPISNIRLDDKRFQITTNRENAAISDSITRLGLLIPPCLRTTEDGFLIVSGFRRVRACIEIGCQTINAVILRDDQPVLECARRAIAENAFQRELNPIEISRALNLVRSLTRDTRTMTDALIGTGLDPHPALIDRFLPFCRLPEDIQEGFLSDELTLATLNELVRMEEREAAALAGFFMDLKPGASLQREMITMLSEIAFTEDRQISEIIQDEAIQSVLMDAGMTDRNLRCRCMRDVLRRRRFPELTRYEAKFNAHVDSLALGKYIKIVPPRDHESNSYTFQMSVSSLTEFQAAVNRLSDTQSHPALLQIFDRFSN